MKSRVMMISLRSAVTRVTSSLSGERQRASRPAGTQPTSSTSPTPTPLTLGDTAQLARGKHCFVKSNSSTGSLLKLYVPQHQCSKSANIIMRIRIQIPVHSDPDQDPGGNKINQEIFSKTLLIPNIDNLKNNYKMFYVFKNILTFALPAQAPLYFYSPVQPPSYHKKIQPTPVGISRLENHHFASY